MLVNDPLLANFAEVEVLAHRALVTDTYYRTDTTTVTSNVAMGLQLDLRAVRTCLLSSGSQIFNLSELCKDKWSRLLELLGYQLLESVSRRQLASFLTDLLRLVSVGILFLLFSRGRSLLLGLFNVLRLDCGGSAMQVLLSLLLLAGILLGLLSSGSLFEGLLLESDYILEGALKFLLGNFYRREDIFIIRDVDPVLLDVLVLDRVVARLARWLYRASAFVGQLSFGQSLERLEVGGHVADALDLALGLNLERDLL